MFGIACGWMDGRMEGVQAQEKHPHSIFFERLQVMRL
jgi:hypothetical protein